MAGRLPPGLVSTARSGDGCVDFPVIVAPAEIATDVVRQMAACAEKWTLPPMRAALSGPLCIVYVCAGERVRGCAAGCRVYGEALTGLSSCQLCVGAMRSRKTLGATGNQRVEASGKRCALRGFVARRICTVKARGSDDRVLPDADVRWKLGRRVVLPKRRTGERYRSRSFPAVSAWSVVELQEMTGSPLSGAASPSGATKDFFLTVTALHPEDGERLRLRTATASISADKRSSCLSPSSTSSPSAASRISSSIRLAGDVNDSSIASLSAGRPKSSVSSIRA